MFSLEDTVVAISTPPGRGGIGVVRVSGPGAAHVAAAILDRREPLAPRHATLARVVSPLAGTGRPVDQVVATYFPAPASYTGEDVVEVSAHGSPVVMRQIVSAALAAGARLAEPGEFTMRAYLNGRMDLVQAEAVADLIDAVTPLQARAAFDQLEGTLTAEIGAIDQALFDLVARFEASIDFPEEGYHFVEPGEAVEAVGEIDRRIRTLLCDARRGRLIREGVQVVIVGKPNVGKSTLFNLLVGSSRAIVSNQPGTTRDLVSETADIDGIRMSLVDTAGIRETADGIELDGVSRARGALSVADLALVVLDRSVPLGFDDHALLQETRTTPRVVVTNKTDLPAAWPASCLAVQSPVVEISLVSHEGIERLSPAMIEAIDAGEPRRDTPAVTNIRHIDLLERASRATRRAMEAIGREGALSEEFVLADLQEARSAFEEITGTRTSEDLLKHIFQRFCVGK